MEAKFNIRKAMAGDKEALVSLIMARENEYYRLAYIYMKNREDAMDALEDMILIIYKKIKTLKKEEAFYSWSKKILISCCLNKIRKQKKIILFEKWEQQDPRDDYQTKAQELDLEKELEKLHFKQREAIQLRYFLDLDYKTISELTSTPLGTVKSRIFNGLRNLKKGFGGEY